MRSSEHETLEHKSGMKKAACEFKMISFHHFPEEVYFSLKSSWVDRLPPLTLRVITECLEESKGSG